MQGFILDTKVVNENDLVVSILTPNRLIKTYRFYGVRHSVIMVGNFIDFEVEERPLFLPKLHSTMQLSLPFSNNHVIISYWQTFCDLLYGYLKDNEICELFYYQLCLELSDRLIYQEPRRAILDIYSKILKNEGRSYNEQKCYECGCILNGEISVGEGLIVYCRQCKSSIKIDIDKIFKYLKYDNSAIFNQDEVNTLFELVKYKF